MAVNKTFWIKQGDLLPILRGRIFDAESGAGQDLSLATELRFHMSDPETREVLIDSTLVTPFGDQSTAEDAGWWEYAWQAGDTGPFDSEDDISVFLGEMQATFAGKPLTGPNKNYFKVKMWKQLN